MADENKITSEKDYSSYYSQNIDKPTNDAYMNYLKQSKENNDSYIDTLLKDSKNNSWQNLQKSNVALANAKASALKSTNNLMKASGFGSQGYGESNLAKNNNAYLNALGQNRSQYSENIANAEQSALEAKMENQQNYDSNYLNMLSTEYQNELAQYYNRINQAASWAREDQQADELAKQTENDSIFTNVLTYLSSMDGYENAINYLKTSGYMDENGNYNSSLSASEQQQIKNVLSYLQVNNAEPDQIGNIKLKDGDSFGSSMKNIFDNFIRSSIKKDNSPSEYEEAIKQYANLQNAFIDGTIKNGDYLEVNIGGASYYLYVKNNEAYSISASDYKNASSSKKKSYKIGG